MIIFVLIINLKNPAQDVKLGNNIMIYKILKSHQVFKDGILDKVAVLWVSNPDNDWVRASYFTRRIKYGYGYLKENEELNSQLLQQVAAKGIELPDVLKKKYFPGKYRWER